jgi:thiamine biosynthesis lipoprotein
VLVSLGGDVALAGPAPRGGWVVAVQERPARPDAAPEADAPPVQVTLYGGGLATSTTTARRWVRGERVLHHILDPRTGLPAGGAWRTVSVAAGSCLDANAASTAAIVRGGAAVDWLRGLGLPARLVDRTGGVTLVGGWPREVAA